MNIKYTLLFAAALLLSLPAGSARANKGAGTRRQDPLTYKRAHNARRSKRKGKVRARGGMVSRVKAWQRRNANNKGTARSHVANRTVSRRGARTTRVWHKRSYETRRGSRASKNRVRYRISGKRFSRSTIATLVRAGLLRRGKAGKLYVLGSGKVKRGSRRYRPGKRFRLFSGRRISGGNLKRLWKLASRTRPARAPGGRIPLAKLWK